MIQITLGLFLVGLLIWFSQKIDFSEIFEILKAAKPKFLVLTVLSVILFWALRAVLLQRLLATKEAVTYPLCFSVTLLGMLTDQMIPGRVGQLVRWGMLSVKTSLSKSFVLFCLIAFVALEFIGLIFWAAISFASAFEKGASSGVDPRLFLVIIPFFTLIAGLLYFSPLIKSKIPIRFFEKLHALESFFEFLFFARHLRRAILWLGIAVCLWGLQILIVYFSAAAVSLSIEVWQCALLLLAINIGIAVPIIPGNLGSMQLIIVGVMQQFGFDSELSLAFAILYHSAHLLPLFFIGGGVGLFSGLPLRQLSK